MLALLLARIVLHIDTQRGIFRVSVGRVFRFDLEWLDMVPQPVIRVFWWEWRPPFGVSPEKKPEKKKKRRAKGNTPASARLRLVTGVLGSFRLKRFELDLDTDDYVLNAQLYPVNHLVWGERAHININWQNENRLLLVLESRVGRILYRIVKTKTS